MLNFIVIDDSKIDLMIASKTISTSGIDFETLNNFTSAVEALEHIRNSDPAHHTVMLIDIQMPVMNGFAFMDEFEKLPELKRKHYTCMYLTSSLNDIDRLRAQKYTDIKAFINKPITVDKLHQILKNTHII